MQKFKSEKTLKAEKAEREKRSFLNERKTARKKRKEKAREKRGDFNLKRDIALLSDMVLQLIF